MIHEIFPVGPLQCNCSVIGDPETREAIVVDPGDDVERVLSVLAAHRLTLRQIVVTHAHLDHIGGAMKLKRATGAAILLNQNDQALLKMLPLQAAWLGMRDPGRVDVDQNAKEGDLVQAGSLTAQVIETPGHTEGSICLLFRSQGLLIAGDTLFQGSIGRTDLPGGSTRKILSSIHEKLLVLADETVVIPGHGPATSIGEEREQNPFLQE